MKTTLLSMALVSYAAAASAQNAPDLQTSAYRNSIAQEEVRKQAEQARAQLQLLLEDFQQNGMNSAEFAQVQQTVAKLSSLSDEQILPLVQMLKEVGSAQQATGAEGKLATASQTQKDIQLNLKTMADHLALQMNEASMEKRLQQLVLSQTGNLKQTKELAVSGKPAAKLPKELAPLYTMSQSEQASIKQETDLMLSTLEKVVGAMPDTGRARFASALDESKKLGLGAMAATAVSDLSGGKFPEAMGSEGRLLDGLQSMLMKIREGKTVGERVGAMANKLQQLAAEQAALAEATAKADPAGQKELKEEQSKISNEVSALKKELTGLNAPASTQADQAEKSMEAAEDKLADKSLKKDEKDAVAKAQADAAAKLQAAGDALQNQAKKMAADEAANAPKTSAEAMQALSQLDQQVKDALAQQKAIDSAPNAATPGAQQKLAEDTAKLQQQALNSSPDAAQNLGQAAAQMAQQDPGATPAQALAQADAQIQDQMAAVQQAMDKQAALQAMAAPIQAAKNQTQNAADTMDKTPKDLSPAVKQMMDAQQTLNQAQNQNNPTSPGDVPAALKEAQAQLESSVLEAAQSKGEQAAAANAKAQAAMNKALQSLDKAMAAAQAEAAAAAPAMAGQPTPGQPTPGQPGAPMPGQPGMPMPGQPGMPTAMAQSGMGGVTQDQGVKGFMGSSGGPGTNGQVTSGIKPKDRDAVSLLQKEKAPAEYQGMVQQYLKNLAEGSAPGHGVQ